MDALSCSAHPVEVKTAMMATIAVSASAAAIGPGAGSVTIVTAHKAAVSTMQITPRSLDTDLTVVPFDMTWLVALIGSASQRVRTPAQAAGNFPRCLS